VDLQEYIICNYPEEPHIAATTWLCTCLFHTVRTGTESHRFIQYLIHSSERTGSLCNGVRCRFGGICQTSTNGQQRCVCHFDCRNSRLSCKCTFYRRKFVPFYTDYNARIGLRFSCYAAKAFPSRLKNDLFHKSSPL